MTAALNGTGQSDIAVSNFSGGSVDILFALNASSVTLTASPNPDPLGSPVTLTAAVTPPSATGTVAFFAGSLSLGSAPVNAGTATLTVSIPHRQPVSSPPPIAETPCSAPARRRQYST